jgi:hypothetical protein
MLITREYAETISRQLLDDARRELVTFHHVSPCARVLLRSGKIFDFRMAWDNDLEKIVLLRHVEDFIKGKRAVAGFFVSEIWMSQVAPDDDPDVEPSKMANRIEGVSCCCKTANFTFAMYFQFLRMGEALHIVGSEYDMLDADIRVFGTAFNNNGGLHDQ